MPVDNAAAFEAVCSVSPSLSYNCHMSSPWRLELDSESRHRLVRSTRINLNPLHSALCWEAGSRESEHRSAICDTTRSRPSTRPPGHVSEPRSTGTASCTFVCNSSGHVTASDSDTTRRPFKLRGDGPD